jgi:hypothetical protein
VRLSALAVRKFSCTCGKKTFFRTTVRFHFWHYLVTSLIFFKKTAKYFGSPIIIFNFALQSTFNFIILYPMNQQAEDIKVIREMMEKSSKFLSLSGLSGIFAGLFATAGAAFAYFYLLQDPAATIYSYKQEVMILLADALLVLILSISFGLYFSWRKAKNNRQKLFNSVTKRVIYNLTIPLVAGGIFSFLLLMHGNIEFVAASTLVFYGLALINASKYTFDEIHYLGIIEIVLGLLAAIFLDNGILFWTIGFGFCHIFYGWIMYNKYDQKKI